MRHPKGERSLKKNMVLNLSSKIEAVDSCVILRALEGDIPEQAKKAVDLFLCGKDLYVSEAVICEVVYVLKKDGYERKDIVGKLTTLLHNPMFIYDREFFEPIFKDYVVHPSLSFEDLVIAKYAEGKNCIPLWTFDKKFANQSKVAKLLK